MLLAIDGLNDKVLDRFFYIQLMNNNLFRFDMLLIDEPCISRLLASFETPFFSSSDLWFKLGFSAKTLI